MKVKAFIELQLDCVTLLGAARLNKSDFISLFWALILLVRSISLKQHSFQILMKIKGQFFYVADNIILQSYLNRTASVLFHRPNSLRCTSFVIAALLKKTKWKSVDNDSPGVSSEESGSIGSTNSNYSLDSLPPSGKNKSSL